MDDGKVTFKKVITIIYLMFVHVLAIGFLIVQFVLPYVQFNKVPDLAVSDPTITKDVPTPLPVPSAFHDPALDNINSFSNSNSNSIPPPTTDDKGPLDLIIPVVGVKGEQLRDTFADSRDSGRVHDAIDIMAAGGTPVIAAQAGKIIRFHESVPGGITIYQQSLDQRYVYYYAHLQRRADGLQEGQTVAKGSTIGYVGDTGNAGPGNYHLHFSIFLVTDPKRLWQGLNINPYPLLRTAPNR